MVNVLYMGLLYRYIYIINFIALNNVELKDEKIIIQMKINLIGK